MNEAQESQEQVSMIQASGGGGIDRVRSELEVSEVAARLEKTAAEEYARANQVPC